MVQLKKLTTLYFTFTLRFFNFYFRPNQPGQSNFFFFSLLHKEHLGAGQQHFLCPKCKNIFPTAALAHQTTQNTILFWLQITPRGTLSKSPSKSTSAVTETQFSSVIPRSKDLYFANQTPHPNNNDPLKQSVFFFPLTMQFLKIIIKKRK